MRACGGGSQAAPLRAEAVGSTLTAMRASLSRARRKAGSALVEGFFAGAARLGKLHPQSDPARHGVEVIEDLAYGTRGLRLDVYRPRSAPEPLPVVFYVHGGGFRILSKDTHWIMGLAFARQGYLVFNIDYRLAPEHPFPAAVEDVAEAYAWIARHAASFGGDLDRIAIAGESAGANLATTLTLCALTPRDEPFARTIYETELVPRAVLPACGIFQVSDTARFARRKPSLRPFVAERIYEVESGYLGRDPSRHGASLDLADPLCWLERGGPFERPIPPFFLPCGTKDPLLDDNRRMAAALRALGADVDERYYPGEVHAFHAFVFREQARRCWNESYAFLDTHLSF